VQSGDIRKHKNDVLRLSMLFEKYSRVATAYGL
jgi:hypothetical protein